MATTKTKRVIEIDVTTSKGLQQGIRQVNAQLRSIEGNAKKTGREVKKMSRNFDIMRVAAGAFIALRIGRAVTDISDSMILLGARINIVTEETIGVEQAFADLFDVAEKTRQSIDATGTLYARLGFSTKALGLDHQTLLDIVQGVNNSLLLSGASAQESASSIIQLSQAFSKGALDGDEFRSVSEGNVVLFGAMQDVLGKTAGELRQFSRDGKLTADLMAQVLTSDQVKGLQSRVDEIPLTFDQAFAKIKNSFSQMARAMSPLFTEIAGWFEAFAQGVSVDLTIGKGFSEGIISFGDVLERGLGSFEQRKQLADEVNQVLSERNAIEEHYRFMRKLGVEEEARAIDALRASIEEYSDEIQGHIAIIEDLSNSEIAITQSERRLNTLQRELAIKGDLYYQNIAIVENARDEYEYTQAQLAAEEKRKKLIEESTDEYNKLALAVRTPLEIMNDTLKNLERLRDLGFDETVLDSAATEAMLKYADSVDKASKSMDEAEKASIELGVAIGNSLSKGVGEIGDALFDYMVGIETSFKQTITNILEDIGRLIVQITLLNALKAGLSGTPAGGFLFPSANGNVFQNGTITPFATGGVVDSPVLFPMANGTGLMGEAGPEAILPLKRGADGKLGVTAEGGGSAKHVTVTIENKGSQDSEVVSSTATTDINGTVVNIVLDDIRNGGPLRESFRNIREFG